MRNNLTARPPRAAVCLAHPAHEWLYWGGILRDQPDIFYLSPGGFSHRGVTDDFVAALHATGFQGDVEFGCHSEAELFERMLNHDLTWFAELREKLATWLSRVHPDVIYADAYEWYNSAHDLVWMLLDSVVMQRPRAARNCERREIGIGIQTMSAEDCLAEVARRGWHHRQVSDEAVAAKRQLLGQWTELCERAGIGLTDDLGAIVRSWPAERVRWEFDRPAPIRNYAEPPSAPHWPTYDERGRRRVASGRSQHAILFATHFAPLAEALNATAHRWQAA